MSIGAFTGVVFSKSILGGYGVFNSVVSAVNGVATGICMHLSLVLSKWTPFRLRMKFHPLV